MTARVVFTVYGTPAPQGSKTRTKHAMFDSNAKTLHPWRDAVRTAAVDAIDGHDGVVFPAGVPVRAYIVITLKKPASAPKGRTTYPIKARSGDLDKLVRGIFDALTDSGAWHDDSQVVELRAAKTYPNEHLDAPDRPGALIIIDRLEGG